jgi:hypothetical protein
VTTACALATDAAGAAVVAAFDAAQIESILLKGPTIADWLYPGELRPYVDADLLVSPDQVMRAAAVLKDLGFGPFDRHVSPHAHPWIRGSDGAQVDLHVTIWGPHRPAQRVWEELRRAVEVRRIAAIHVRVLNQPARALHVVLHAAQHRENRPQTREDLRRAIDGAPLEAWLEAEMLADRLWALGEMADGLLLEPAGQELLECLPLVRAAAMVNHKQIPLAIGFTRMSEARGWRAKARVFSGAFARDLLASEDAPAPSGMVHVALARIRRVVRLSVGVPRTLSAWRRARRRAGIRR